MSQQHLSPYAVQYNLTRPQSGHGSSSSTSHALLLQPANASQKQTKPKKSYFRTFCYTFRLHLLWDFSVRHMKWDNQEPPKVAYYKSRRLVAIQSLLHFLPLAAAIVLIYFNIWQYYIGGEMAGNNGEDIPKLGALQFAAKLHELLMLASIGTIVFAQIRIQLAFGEGVTLGTVFAGQQFSAISTLWSMEFWSTVFDANAYRKARRKGAHVKSRSKWLLVGLIAIATVLGVSVGPSSANLMRPRLDWWGSGGTTFWLSATEDEIFPSNYLADAVPSSCSVYTGDYSCPYGDFDSLIEQRVSFWPQMSWMGSMPEAAWSRGMLSLRNVETYFRSPTDSIGRLIWGHVNTHTAAPKAGISDAVAETTRLWAFAAANANRGARFRFRRDVSHSVDSRKPNAELFCTGRNVTDFNASWPLTFANTTIPLQDDITPYQNYVNFNATAEQSSWIRNGIYNTSLSSGQILWVDDQQLLNGTGSTLLAIAAFRHGLTTSYEPTVFTCNIKTFHSTVTYTGTRNSPKTVTTTGRKGDNTLTYPSAAFARLTNPYLPNIGIDVFGKMAAAAGLSAAKPQLPWYYQESAVETIIANMLVNGMSLMPYRTHMSGTLKGRNCKHNDWCGGAWADELLPKSGIGSGGNAYEISPAEEQTSTMFTMNAKCNGYAYSHAGLTQKTALGVLIAYCLLAIAHFFWSIIDARTSGAWDSAPELTAIALNSERSARVQNTGAGIWSSQTMKENVLVRVKEQNRLEMVFSDTQAGGDIVRPSKAYC